MTIFNNINTAEELLAMLTDRLDLSTHTVSFHVIDDEYIAGGLIDEECDLYLSDAFDEIAYIWPEDETVQMSEVVSYQIGSGESESATTEEIELFDAARTHCPDAWKELLLNYADVLCTLTDINLENPAYDPDQYSDE